MFNFIGVFHESSVSCFEFYLEGHPEFSETARYLDFYLHQMEKFYQSKAPYKGMSSFQLGKDNKQGRNASVLEDWYCQSVQ